MYSKTSAVLTAIVIILFFSCTKTENLENKNLYLLGLDKYIQKDFYNASFLFKKASKQSSNNPAALVMLGKSLFFLKKFEEARTAFQTVLNKYPENITAALWLARISILENKNLFQTKQFLADIITNDDENVSAYILLGQIAELNGDIASAIEYYEKALLHDSEYSVIHQKLHTYYKDLNLHKRAEKHSLKR